MLHTLQLRSIMQFWQSHAMRSCGAARYLMPSTSAVLSQMARCVGLFKWMGTRIWFPLPRSWTWIIISSPVRVLIRIIVHGRESTRTENRRFQFWWRRVDIPNDSHKACFNTTKQSAISTPAADTQEAYLDPRYWPNPYPKKETWSTHVISKSPGRWNVKRA